VRASNATSPCLQLVRKSKANRKDDVPVEAFSRDRCVRIDNRKKRIVLLIPTKK